MLLDIIATTLRPFASYSFAKRANSARMCFTNGQCLQMKATSSALLLLKSAFDTILPVKSGSENGGSCVPRSSIVDGVSGMEAPRVNSSLYRSATFGAISDSGPRTRAVVSSEQYCHLHQARCHLPDS